MNLMSGMVFKWYMFITLLAILGATTLTVTDLFSGLMLAWFVFFIFFVGANNAQQNAKKLSLLKHPKNKTNPNHNLYLALLTVPLSIFAVDFYTGKSFLQIYTSILNGVSLYDEYQSHFKNANISVFQISKLPAVFSMFFLKLILVYNFITIICYREVLYKKQIVTLILSTITFLYFSIARGTSFEIFEVMLLLWFCLKVRHSRLPNNNLFSNSNLILFTLGVCALMLYSYNISARYGFVNINECLPTGVCLNLNSPLGYVSDSLALLSLKLSGYFTFGIYYTTTYINEYWFESISDFILLFIPFTYYIDPDLSANFLCEKDLKCGASWIPDIITLLMQLGLLLSFTFISFLGKLSFIFTSKILKSHDFIDTAITYNLLLIMVSLPVGNFLTTSSSNKILIVTLISIYLLRKLNSKL